MLVMFQRALFVMRGITGLPGLMLMIRMLLTMHGQKHIARVRRRGGPQHPGKDADDDKPYGENSHQRAEPTARDCVGQENFRLPYVL